MTLESIVRPFTAPRPLNTRRVIPSSTKKPEEIAGVTWGAVGNLPTAVQSDADGPGLGIDFKVEKKTEKSVLTPMKTKEVRVEQAGNPENFVVFEQMTKYKLKADKPTIFKSLHDMPGTTGFAPAPGTVPVPGAPKETTVTGYGKETPLILDPKEVTINWTITETPP